MGELTDASVDKAPYTHNIRGKQGTSHQQEPSLSGGNEGGRLEQPTRPQPRRKGDHSMFKLAQFKLTLRYARYILSLPATLGWGRSSQGEADLTKPTLLRAAVSLLSTTDFFAHIDCPPMSRII
jgi:hypothetical protein